MDTGDFIKKFLAGLLCIAGVVLLVTVVFIIGLQQGLTEPKFEVHVLFSQVGGMNVSAPVRLSGIHVGTVKDIHFLDQDIKGKSIEVSLDIFKKYEKQFRKCSRITISTEGVLGEKLIDISEDKRRKPFDLNLPLIGEDPLNVEDFAEVITKTASTFNKTTENFNDMMKEFNYITKRSRRMLNRLEQKLLEGGLFKVF